MQSQNLSESVREFAEDADDEGDDIEEYYDNGVYFSIYDVGVASDGWQ